MNDKLMSLRVLKGMSADAPHMPVTKDEVTEDLYDLMTEVYDAVVTKKREGIEMDFGSGQKFCITVKNASK